MKHASRILVAATMTTFFAGGAVAGGADDISLHGAIVTAMPKEATADNGTVDQARKASWERSQIIAMMEQKQSTQVAVRQPWERGQLMGLLGEQGTGVGGSDAGTAQTAPRVVIYFDASGTEPGLMQELGNTHAGRSIMLRYLEQARNNDPQS